MTTVSEAMWRAWNETVPDVVAPRASPVAPRHEQPTLVLGGTGKTGRRVAERLWDRGLSIRPILAGEVVLAAGDVAEPFVDADDIADVAVAALTEDGHSGQLYELTGPRLLNFAEAVAEIAQATEREIRNVQVAPEAYAAALAEQGVPADYVWLMNYLFTTVLDGRNASLADGVQRALGREPRDFADYARETASSGVWNVPALVGA